MKVLGTRHMCDPSGRADAADCCRGAPIEVRTRQPGQECQPMHLTRRAPPARRQTDPLADESAPSAAAAIRGLHKDRHRPMTAESRLPSMHSQWTAGQMGGRHEAQPREMDAKKCSFQSTHGTAQALYYNIVCQQTDQPDEPQIRIPHHVDASGRTREEGSADMPRGQKTRETKDKRSAEKTKGINRPTAKKN